MNGDGPEPKRHWRKHFLPLESNPDVFTELIHKLGMSDSLSFQDVYSLDDPELLALIPRPAHALVLVFPTTRAYEKRVVDEDARLTEYVGCGDGEGVVFFKQTINNACGLYAILHGICNGSARALMGDEALMASLLKACTPLKPDERGLALEDSKELEEAYASVASKGDTAPPENPEVDVDYHYICFVKSQQNGHLYQMDGMRKRPLDLGPLSTEEDVLSDACLRVIRDMIASEQGANLGFNLMALVSE
ncbi:ubiquitin carboxyl-terminal hydrolase, family 1 [Trematosphaeria pertusa]|uniref:Ubiquitin carboxyl-terminal hydrolase n=1 Tax=Trematosphaeria pertusa TaxID=390896 RepID=A0A6A6IBW9_9PLEO|nr:ubiquitin carboxyl-terminal hydrolase, family 1 [Trematosphaeria pertusa]KAF2247749.1 ubiquitin carboxyl-terminal hydrolase, family 1 [Trematosphaeria pertusa]